MYVEKLDVPLSLTFDDVLLEPRASWLEPSEADTRSIFTKKIKLNIPLVSAAMDTVTEATMAIALARQGGIGVIHRNMTPERELQEVQFVKHAEELIERDVLFVEDTSTVSEAERLMHQYSIGGVPVVDKGKIIGIVSRRDVRAIVSKRGDEKITAIMTKKPIVTDEDITADKALEIMYTNKVERLPVVNKKGKLLGIITMQDILEKKQYPFATRDSTGNLRVAAAVGPFDFARADLLDQNGVDALVVDCAHGHNMKVVAAVKDIKGSVKAEVIAGNIATREAAEALVSAGVDGVKVGIGPGSICTTRIVAGVGVPQITAVAQVADIAHPSGIPVISDGGVRFSGGRGKSNCCRCRYGDDGQHVCRNGRGTGKGYHHQGAALQAVPRHGVAWCHEYRPVQRPVLPEEGYRKYKICAGRGGGGSLPMSAMWARSCTSWWAG